MFEQSPSPQQLTPKLTRRGHERAESGCSGWPGGGCCGLSWERKEHVEHKKDVREDLKK